MSANNSADSLLGMFIFESTQLLEQLEETILDTEERDSYTQEDINEIFRIMHTIKGSSAMMELNNISRLAHSLEDLFDFFREGEVEGIDYRALSDLVFDNVDFIKEQIQKIESGAAEDDDASNIVNSNKEFLKAVKNITATEENEESNSDDINLEEHEKDNLDKELEEKQYTYSYKGTIHFTKDSEMENMRAFSVVNNLDEIAEDIQSIPEDLMDSEASEIIKRDGFKFVFQSNYSYVDIHQLLMQTVFLKELELEQVDNGVELFGKFKESEEVELSKEIKLSEEIELSHIDSCTQESIKDQNEIKQKREDEVKVQNKEEKKVQSKVEKNNKNNKNNTPRPIIQHQSIISVPVDKLDKLMDLMGEFVIAEAMVTQNPDLEGLELNNFDKASRQLNKITNELQDIVMSIRMVPLSATFNKMKRLVRDMGRKLDKEVELTIIGEETEVDKNIIEHISDPLMHLVRNALDHGLESTGERISAGKEPVGNITLEAKNLGSDVLVIVKDNGRGIKKESILSKAKTRGLLKRPESTMTDTEIYNLILLPGFSTNENITEYSGRGVGMDVVTRGIEAIGGSVSIDSNENEGTTFIMKIPLTLAIVDGMNIKVGESIYTIPTINIREFFEPVLSDIIIDPDKNEMVMVRGECYPILRLHKAFKVETKKTNFEDGIFIIVQQDNNIMCLFVDELVGQQQIVVKALPEYISKGRKVKGLTGCTLLGDGSISLILDVLGLSDLLQ